MKLISEFLSGLLHPLLLPTYIFTLIFLFFPEIISPLNKEMYVILFLLILVSTCLLPVLMVILLCKAGIIDNITIEKRTDRFLPQAISCVIYGSVTWFCYSGLHQVQTLYHIMASITLCMITVTIINFFWKISAHSTGMGGLVAFFSFCTYFYGEDILLPVLILSVLSAGFVMASRLYLQVHTLSQVCAGFLVGCTTGLIVLADIY